MPVDCHSSVCPLCHPKTQFLDNGKVDPQGIRWHAFIVSLELDSTFRQEPKRGPTTSRCELAAVLCRTPRASCKARRWHQATEPGSKESQTVHTKYRFATSGGGLCWCCNKLYRTLLCCLKCLHCMLCQSTNWL